MQGPTPRAGCCSARVQGQEVKVALGSIGAMEVSEIGYVNCRGRDLEMALPAVQPVEGVER